MEMLKIYYRPSIASDEELTELRLEVGVDLEVEQGPRDRLLELVRLGVVRFHDLGAVGERHLKTTET